MRWSLPAPVAARDLPLLDAAQPLQHIGRPGPELAELAVADDVDAGLGLLRNDLRHRGLEAGLERILLDRDALLDRTDVIEELRRPRERTHVGGQNAVFNAHTNSSPIVMITCRGPVVNLLPLEHPFT